MSSALNDLCQAQREGPKGWQRSGLSRPFIQKKEKAFGWSYLFVFRSEIELSFGTCDVAEFPTSAAEEIGCYRCHIRPSGGSGHGEKWAVRNNQNMARISSESQIEYLMTQIHFYVTAERNRRFEELSCWKY